MSRALREAVGVFAHPFSNQRLLSTCQAPKTMVRLTAVLDAGGSRAADATPRSLSPLERNTGFWTQA